MEKNLINIMESMTGAKALMTAMEKEGVKEVFGYTWRSKSSNV